MRTRTERMHAFESPEAVETVLRELSLRGSVQLLDRQPGHKEPRWQQLLAEEAEPTSVPAGAVMFGGRAAAGTVAGSTAERLAALEARVARLEAALGDLLPDETGPATDGRDGAGVRTPMPAELAIESFGPER